MLMFHLFTCCHLPFCPAADCHAASTPFSSVMFILFRAMTLPPCASMRHVCCRSMMPPIRLHDIATIFHLFSTFMLIKFAFCHHFMRRVCYFVALRHFSRLTPRFPCADVRHATPRAQRVRGGDDAPFCFLVVAERAYDDAAILMPYAMFIDALSRLRLRLICFDMPRAARDALCAMLRRCCVCVHRKRQGGERRGVMQNMRCGSSARDKEGVKRATRVIEGRWRYCKRRMRVCVEVRCVKMCATQRAAARSSIATMPDDGDALLSAARCAETCHVIYADSIFA